ncbi:MAG: hypothetical protein JSW51_03260, partial [Gemmatimonadota bacterium]
MSARYRSLLSIALLTLPVPLVLSLASAKQGVQRPLRFQLRLDEAAAAEVSELGLEVPIVGRAFVIVSRNTQREPRQQIGVTGVPFWGKDVRDMRPATV